MSVKERIERYAASKGKTMQWVSAECGISKSYFNNTKNPNPEVLNKLSEVFPDLNIGWLLLGKGEMLKKEDNQHCHVHEDADCEYKHTFCDSVFLANKIKIAKEAIDDVYGAGYADRNSAFVAEVLKAAAHFEMSKSVDTLKYIIRQAEKAELKQLKEE